MYQNYYKALKENKTSNNYLKITESSTTYNIKSTEGN